MPTHRISIFDLMQGAPANKAAVALRLPSVVRNEVFLNVLLAMAGFV